MSGVAPLSVSFSASASGGTLPYTYLWRFGDGGTGSGMNVAHPYNQPGVYNAVLQVTDSVGNVAFDTVVIHAYPILPDLIVSDVSFSPAAPIDSSSVQVNATIRNVGFATSSVTIARFYDGSPPAPQIGVHTIVPIPVNGTQNVSVTWTASPSGSHNLCIVADPDKTMAEVDETNNMKCVPVDVQPGLPPAPPTNLTAFLSGSQDENVTVRWDISSDDGGGAKNVENYYIFRGSKYRRNASSYQLIATVANGTEEFVDASRGDGDLDNYFYLVCSMDSRNLSGCSSNQAGKFSQNLTAGLQLISIPLVPSNTSITDIFRTIEYDKAWSYLNGEFDPWKSFSKEKAINDLLDIRGSMGIWINVTSNDRLVVAGSVPLETAIALRPGWNLVGFPSFDDNYTVADLKAAVAVERIEGFDGSTPPYFLRVMSDGGFLQAGFGYWIKVESPAVWTVENV
jgi:hypothetical protein